MATMCGREYEGPQERRSEECRKRYSGHWVGIETVSPPKESPQRLKPKVLAVAHLDVAGQPPQRIAPAIETILK